MQGHTGETRRQLVDQPARTLQRDAAHGGGQLAGTQSQALRLVHLLARQLFQDGQVLAGQLSGLVGFVQNQRAQDCRLPARQLAQVLGRVGGCGQQRGVQQLARRLPSAGPQRLPPPGGALVWRLSLPMRLRLLHRDAFSGGAPNPSQW